MEEENRIEPSVEMALRSNYSTQLEVWKMQGVEPKSFIEFLAAASRVTHDAHEAELRKDAEDERARQEQVRKNQERIPEIFEDIMKHDIWILATDNGKRIDDPSGLTCPSCKTKFDLKQYGRAMFGLRQIAIVDPGELRALLRAELLQENLQHDINCQKCHVRLVRFGRFLAK